MKKNATPCCRRKKNSCSRRTGVVFLVIHPRLERGTPWLKVRCSTDWANGPLKIGWGGRARTYAYRSQSPVPYRLGYTPKWKNGVGNRIWTCENNGATIRRVRPASPYPPYHKHCLMTEIIITQAKWPVNHKTLQFVLYNFGRLYKMNSKAARHGLPQIIYEVIRLGVAFFKNFVYNKLVIRESVFMICH